MSDRKVKVVSHGNSTIQVFTPDALNKYQVNAVKHLLRKLPGYQEEVFEYRVEVHEAEPLIVKGKVLCQPRPTVFFFGETRVKDEAGALILCRENYLFEIGPRGGLTQLMGRKKYL